MRTKLDLLIAFGLLLQAHACAAEVVRPNVLMADQPTRRNLRLAKSSILAF